MKKIIGAIGVSLIASTASASGIVPVLDNRITDVVYSVDLDSVRPSENQVLGGVQGEQYINVLLKTEAYPDSDLRQLDDIHIIAENWIISCHDYSYYKLSRSIYSDNYNFLSSERLGNDIPVKREFIPTNNDNPVNMATRNAALASCHQFDEQQPTHNKRVLSRYADKKSNTVESFKQWLFRK